MRTDVRPSPTRRNRGRRIRSYAALLMVITTLSLTACTQRSPYVGDRVWGELVVASKVAAGEKGPTVDVPQSLSGVLAASPYSDKGTGMVGSRIVFTALPVGQIGDLADLLVSAFPTSSVSMDLSITRDGDVVRFRGASDLSSLAPGQDTVALSIRFAGPISATNGRQSADDTVKFSPESGKSTNFSAEADYADPSTAAFGDWTWIVAGLTLVVVIAVGALAYLARDTSPRPGQPARR
ncbi:DUF3153 domain-containing protein [Williamsia sp. CHRR-6]|uniref:LppM family (lipo)protein n=1 Tax=Williamsia sp. CHRR-6 TaxID=2835871 RepID=UPI001BDB4896|nr:DUF3153 domain-containing protein [Williamsia sp. CHRR-6]MBT0565276.1 DUF3153 domain-containing protein [Williamsia sp. CHRR-6]